MNRAQAIASLLEQPSLWDVLVIGGGATGLGVALDAAVRGLKTALVEQSDFAKGTSSRSTRLIHSGFRYLKQFLQLPGKDGIQILRDPQTREGLRAVCTLPNSDH